MLFNSFAYLLFLPAAYLGFVIAPRRARWLWLLLASLGFYLFLEAPYLLGALAGSTLASYGVGLQIHRTRAPRARKLWLWIGILLNLALLVWLKYLPFLVDNLSSLLGLLGLGIQLRLGEHLLAIGVSYYALQAISYLVDIYLELLEPERHLGRFGLFMSFFPKLLQGPIERGEGLLPQLRGTFRFDAAELRLGLHLLFWGLFKKVAVADRLAPLVNTVYDHVHDYTGLPLLLATYLYALQLYFDFSGYTDTALGTARLFGIRLTQNFQGPYLAPSMIEFWRRWHISFSSWILSYIFKPLQVTLRRWRRLGTPVALLATFLVSGIWHGAGWRFILWGLIHGVYLAAAVLYQPLQKKLVARLGLGRSRAWTVWRVVVTFHLACLAWVFFRANTVADALQVVRGGLGGLLRGQGTRHDLLLGQTPSELALAIGFLALALLVGAVEWRHTKDRTRLGELAWLMRLPSALRAAVYAVGLYSIIFYGAKAQSFIYLQF
jgi:D-alanyl-lipoteichoic acid acyltransferase DltB (MBOAT superfamily)